MRVSRHLVGVGPNVRAEVEVVIDRPDRPPEAIGVIVGVTRQDVILPSDAGAGVRADIDAVQVAIGRVIREVDVVNI